MYRHPELAERDVTLSLSKSCRRVVEELPKGMSSRACQSVVEGNVTLSLSKG